MAKVQREQGVKPMNGGRGNMGGITVGIRREKAAVNDFARKGENRLGDVQQDGP